MDQHEQTTVKQRRVRQNRLYRTALYVSVLAHLVLFFFWRTVPLPTSPFSAAGPRAGDFQAAGGGMQALSLEVPPSRPIVPPAVPIISLDVVDPVLFDPEPQIDLSVMMAEGTGLGDGPPGIEGGQGRGDGGTAAQGRFTLEPPKPRGLFLPTPDRSLRGSQVEVWVFVDAHGKVVADSTRLNPPTRDRGYNRELIRKAAEWVFNPARRDGQPVPSWFPYTISM